MDPLLSRRQALEHLGFVATEHEAGHLVCARVRWHWDLFMRASTVVRVRRVHDPAVAEARDALQALMRQAPRHDWSKLPRGFLQFRAVIDVLLLDAPADDALKRWAAHHVAKGFGASGHPVLVEPDGTVTLASPIWGAAFWPKTRHCAEVAATAQATPEPAALLGALVGWLVFVPSVLAILLSCCGLPLLAVPALRLAENRPDPAALPG